MPRRAAVDPDLPQGVYRLPNGKFRAKVFEFDGERHLGVFDTIPEAAFAVDRRWRYPKLYDFPPLSTEEIAKRLRMTPDEVEEVLARALLKLARGLRRALRDRALVR